MKTAHNLCNEHVEMDGRTQFRRDSKNRKLLVTKDMPSWRAMIANPLNVI